MGNCFKKPNETSTNSVMGNCFKKPNETSTNSKETSPSTLHSITEERSYEAACEEDMAELQSFDLSLQRKTNKVLSTLATDEKGPELSFDSMKEVTGCLLDMNQEVAKVISDYKSDIWSDKEMLELLKEYFDTSLKMIDFCKALKEGMSLVRVTHRNVLNALWNFDDERRVHGGNGYMKAIEALKKSNMEESALGENFFNMFQSVYKQQTMMLEKLQLHMNKINKRMKTTRRLRKLSKMIFITTIATVLICSVVAAAMAAPPVASALASASAVPLPSISKWVDSLWEKHEKKIKQQKELIYSMKAVSHVLVFKDLKELGDLVERLENEVKENVKSVKSVLEHDAVTTEINAIAKKLKPFEKHLNELGIQADTCAKDVVKTRNLILQRVFDQHDY